MEEIEKKILKTELIISKNYSHSKLYSKIKLIMSKYIFPLIFFINQTQTDNIHLDCLIIIIDTLQLLSFPFQLRVSKNNIIIKYFSLLNFGKSQNFIRNLVN